MHRWSKTLPAIFAAILGLGWPPSATAESRPNVLFIAVDDLRPELRCYGAKHVHSPHIDRFAETAVRFDRAYCQQAVCNPSRTSLMTGLRPDTIGVTGNHSHFRANLPEVVTLPQHFKNHGYHAAAIGKLYHGVFPDGCSNTSWDTMGDPQSWSVPAIRFGPRYYYTEEGIEAAKATFERVYKPTNPGPDDWTRKLVFGPATESPDVPDSALYDGQVADTAVETLRKLKQKPEQPFFLAVGFIKPHSPYIAPKKYFDLYDDVEIADDPTLPSGAPAFAGHGSGELRRYTDQPPRGEIGVDNQRRVRQAYYACVSYIDAQIGRVLKELDRLGLADNTIVSLYGDHGYHLGEQGLWGKTTNFELDTRVPLLIRVPGMKAAGEASTSLVELVDLYPTLADLAGLPVGDQLEGKSLSSLLDEPTQMVKAAAISQYPRGGGLMGYSMRTPTHRLTQWVHRASGELRATELYDYAEGSIETKNIAESSQQLAQELSNQFALISPRSFVPTGPANDQKEIKAARIGDSIIYGYGTSFEQSKPGPFRSLETRLGHWKTLRGIALIDKQHATTGQQCLQLTGGEETVVELELADGVNTAGNLTFRAERWTKRTPFSFRIEKQSAGKWTEIHNGDKQVRVGRPFLTTVDVALDDPKISRLRFSVVSPPNAGMLFDDVRIAAPRPQQVTDVEVVPFALPALVGNENCPLLKLRIETSGHIDPISLTQLQLTLLCDEGDVESARVYSSGANSQFTTTTPFGKNHDGIGRETIREAELATGNLAASATAALTITGQQTLAEGNNYVWVAGKLSDQANVDHRVGAICQALEFANGETVELDTKPSIQRMGVRVRNGGDDGVHTYRIPGLATTLKGSLIAVYDVRRRGGGDLPGDIDVGMSRSTDGGRTWQPMKVIMDMGNDPRFRYDGIGDPTVLVDKVTGTVWCAATWSHGNRSWFGSQPGLEPVDTGQFILVHSEDDGITWSEPINITKQVKKPEWSFLLQGPGKGITMSDGTIVLPAQYQDPPHPTDAQANRLPHSTFIYSRDHGKTWNTATAAWNDTTESQVVELKDGQLMINCRNNRLARRAILTTSDRGQTWIEHPTHNQALIEPGACMASLINVGRELSQRGLTVRWPTSDRSTGKAVADNEFLLFSNPDSLEGRNHITIKASLDGGLTWPSRYHLLLDEQNGRGYSCMSMIDSETVGIIYEGSQAHMTFQRVKIADILDPPKREKTKNLAQVATVATNSAARRAQQEFAIARVFGDHMVLQARQPIRIWGHARPGAEVNVAFGAANAKATTDGSGRWQVEFPAQPYNAEPQTLTATSGRQAATIRDVLLGEVWLCAGQSNMEWPLSKSTGGKEAVRNSHDPQLRLMNFAGAARGGSGVYTEAMLARLEPAKFGSGHWQVASPESSPAFSAVGYYFGQQLRAKLDCPVGMINLSIGGTPIEAWVNSRTLADHPTLRRMVRGNWLDNGVLDPWCQTRAKFNLQRGLTGELKLPGDQFGPHHSFKPGFMYEAGIKPFTPMSIRGVLWYQGESNGDNPDRIRQYDSAFPLLVSSWRTAFRNEQLPVAFVQLPTMGRPNWPVFREYQRRSLSMLKNVGMAITIDTGDRQNVHPAEKQPVGQRLAQWALAKTYAHPGPAMGPLYRSKRVEGSSLVLTFDTGGDVLVSADGAPPNNFEVAGDDGVYHPATARIDGNQVRLDSPKVPQPENARYAWSDFPDPKPNLFNASGVPASPLTTTQEIPDGQPVVDDDRPNILLIVSEDNGPELGCYGDKYATTPNLDALASQGMRFKTAYVTQAVCSPSRGSLLTGLFPHQNGQIGLATHSFRMFKAWPTTYSILKEAGYRTGMLGKLHVNPEHVVEDYIDFRAITSANFAKKNLDDYAKHSHDFISSSRKPFFLTVNFPDAHWPVQNQVESRPQKLLQPDDVAPMPYIGFDNARLRRHVQGYYNCLTRLDECVGELLDVLEKSGKADNTLVIYIGDHGAQFARGKVYVTEAGLRIPFIVRWPEKAKAGYASSQMVSTIDILPTIVNAARATVPNGLPGKDLAPILGGDETPIREYLFAERNTDASTLHYPQRAIRDARYKLIKTLMPGSRDPATHRYLINGASNFRGSPTYQELETASEKTQAVYADWLDPPEYQLFDLHNDPNEFENVADNPQLADVRSRLTRRLERWQRETADRLADPKLLAKLTAEVEHCLKNNVRVPEGGWKYLEYLDPDQPTDAEQTLFQHRSIPEGVPIDGRAKDDRVNGSERSENEFE